MNFIIWLVVGGIVGWIASLIMRTDAQQGMLLNVIVGIIGAFVGGWLISQLVGVCTINQNNFSISSMIVSLVGAVILLAIVNLFRRGRVRGPAHAGRRRQRSGPRRPGGSPPSGRVGRPPARGGQRATPIATAPERGPSPRRGGLRAASFRLGPGRSRARVRIALLPAGRRGALPSFPARRVRRRRGDPHARWRTDAR